MTKEEKINQLLKIGTVISEYNEDRFVTSSLPEGYKRNFHKQDALAMREGDKEAIERLDISLEEAKSWLKKLVGGECVGQGRNC